MFQCNPPPYYAHMVFFFTTTILLLLFVFRYYPMFFMRQRGVPAAEPNPELVRMNPEHHRAKHDAAARLSEEMPDVVRKYRKEKKLRAKLE